MRQYLENVDTEEDLLDHDTFRLKVKENLIDKCDMALDALKEGLSLGGM